MFKDLFFPRTCALCGKVVGDDPVLCRECLTHLPRTEQAVIRGNTTEELFAGLPRFQRGAVFLFFEHGDKYHRLIHQMKYGVFADPTIGYLLAKEAAADYLQSDFFDGIDLILPVPLHPRRLRERGFNQAEWIAKGLSEITHIPVNSALLIRKRSNEHQANLSRQERLNNVQDLFALTEPKQLSNRHVLLVDDVITTGATVRACMAAFKSVRNCKISVFGIAKSNSLKSSFDQFWFQNAQ